MPEIRIRDTLSGELRTVESDGSGGVGIYACGPTVYSRVHVGNARPFVVFMLLRRLFDWLGHDARLVINVTDINDKIYAAARDAGVPSDRFAAEMTQAYIEDTDRLGLGRPDIEPLATQTLAEIVAVIEALIERGHAYESGGDVYFRVRSQPGYGKLSNRDPAEMDQGEEAGSEQLKEDALDFALWKATKADEDTAWPSPWSEGRPGWHIECSAMAERYLGTNFAIHGGGVDLVFPHHENEIAQTEAARSQPLARIWMHNGMVLAGAEMKMAKSEGNVFLLHEALDRFGPEAVIAFLISGHYRQPLAFGEDALVEAAARNERIRNFFRDAERPGTEPDDSVVAAHEAFTEALCDDFNTPRAMAAIYDLVAEGHRRPLAGAHEALTEMLRVVGLESLAVQVAAADPRAEALLVEREEARSAGDFERADRLRDELTERGYEIRDTAEGPKLIERG